ncbi:MAG: hypothetical protein B7Z10_05790 [Rhodobacterales bacterium 32-66-7]|nr:MAG: hypothetical protein B7Z10_05790 [Rhodobacterales bacterium 32-66-7]
MTGDGAQRVFRRRVFYIPGYDPFPPRRYRELYRKEGRLQASISGYDLTLTARPPDPDRPYGWRVNSRMDSPTEVEVEVLVWSDLVQRSMRRGVAGTYWLLLRTAWVYGASGALWALLRLRKGPMIAALYPAVLLVGQALLALGVAWLALWLLADLPWGGEWLVAAAMGWAVLEGFRRIDRRLFVYYLLHDYAFTAVAGGAYPPVLKARLTEFRHMVAAALATDVDEVLLVAHSSGVHLGVSVLADLIRAGVPASAPALGFLSLGQAVPMASFLPGAGRLRADLAYLSTRAEVTWVDVTAPGDGCCFALCDPVAVSGVAPAGQIWPLVISAAFSRTLSAARWAELKRQYFRLHFQYLCAFDNLRGGRFDYDYFRITAGPLTLADRFRGRQPSASRITTPRSPHRGLE